METLIVGVVTISDRASRKEYQDLSGPAIVDWLKQTIKNPLTLDQRLVPDEQPQIEQQLVELADETQCQLILTTGGTGPSPRDKTPEATLAVADRVLPGFGERMRSLGLQYVPTAILSRQLGAVRGQCLILNLPGQPKAIQETLTPLFEAVPYCLELISKIRVQVDEQRVKAFRPKSAKH